MSIWCISLWTQLVSFSYARDLKKSIDYKLQLFYLFHPSQVIINIFRLYSQCTLHSQCCHSWCINCYFRNFRRINSLSYHQLDRTWKIRPCEINDSLHIGIHNFHLSSVFNRQLHRLHRSYRRAYRRNIYLPCHFAWNWLKKQVTCLRWNWRNSHYESHNASHALSCMKIFIVIHFNQLKFKCSGKPN